MARSLFDRSFKLSVSSPLIISLLLLNFLSIIPSSAIAQSVDLRAGFSAVDMTPYDFIPAPSFDLCPHGHKPQPFLASTIDDDKDFLNANSTANNLCQFVPLGGYAPYYPIPWVKWNRPAQGVHDPIWARAIAIEGQNGVKTLLMATDLPGLTWKHINPVRREIEKTYGIPFSNIIIASTHDHAAPDAAGYWVTGMVGHNKWFTDRVRVAMFKAASEAIESMQAAKMKTIMTTHIACYNLNTMEWKKDPDCNIPMNITDYQLPGGDQYDQEAVQADKRSPIVRNTNITALQFVAKSDGHTLGTMINWHNHPDTLGGNNLILSSDYPNYLRQYVEKALGGIAVYFTGTLGCQIGAAKYVPAWSEDMQPLYRPDGARDPHGNLVRAYVPFDADGWSVIRSIGYEVGSEVVKAIQAKKTFNDTVDVSVRTEQIDVNPSNVMHVVFTHSVWAYDVAPEDKMHRYKGRCEGRYGCVRSDVSLLQIGDLSLITAPGEIDPAYFMGRPTSVAHWGGKIGDENFPAMQGIKSLLKGPYVAVFGQANNYLSYLLPESDNIGPLNFSHPNHYEEFVTVSKYFGDDLGNKWMQMLGSNYRYNQREILPK